MTGLRRITFVILPAMVSLTCSALADQSASSATTRRIAPVILESEDASGGLSLGEPRVVDDLESSASTRRIIGFLFRIEKTPVRSAVATLEVETGDGRKHVLHDALEDLRAGDDVHVAAGIPVPREAEGRMRAILTLRSRRGGTLFTGAYVFGYPRYWTTRGLTRVSTSTPVRDSFDSDRIDERIWEVVLHDPAGAAVEQKDGRLQIGLNGKVGYNGLVSRIQMDSRDVVLACRMGIDSPSGSPHRALLHLCGSGLWSPDNWIEIAMGGAITGAETYLNVSTPEYIDIEGTNHVRLPAPAREGSLFEIACEAASRLCRGYVRAGDEWRQIGDAIEIPARKSRVELKSEGWLDRDSRSTVWFDDCRMYPSPELHYVTVVLQRGDGGGPGLGAGGRWPPLAFGPTGAEVGEDALVVRLYARDGATLVDQVVARPGDGYALLKLDASPWDIYPAAAIVRVFIGGSQLGPDHVMESAGVEGLYPDDVYVIEID